jgi:hypothetical protein
MPFGFVAGVQQKSGLYFAFRHAHAATPRAPHRRTRFGRCMTSAVSVTYASTRFWLLLRAARAASAHAALVWTGGGATNQPTN